MLSEEKTLLKIYSLYVLVDGKWSSQTKENLDEIAKKLNIDQKDANEIYGDSRAEVWSSVSDVNLSDDFSFEVILKIDDAIRDGAFWMNSATDSRDYKSKQADVLLNMIMLGYDDGKYSNPEKKVVEHLSIRWKINPIILAEFVDTAETLMMLERQKEWLKTTRQPYDEISRQLEIVDQNIKEMLKNAQTTVSEVDVM